MRDLFRKDLLLISILSFCWIPNGHTQSSQPDIHAGHIIYLKLPAGISRAAVLAGSQQTKTELNNYTRNQIAALVPVDSQSQDIDRIIIFTDQHGEPILPNAARTAELDQSVARLTSGELTYTFNSPEQPWSASELTTLNTYLNDFYPAIKNVIGNPFFSITVNVSKDASIGSSGYYVPSTNEMVLKSLTAHVFCHESIHAFRDDFIMGLGSYEEGMTRAAEIEVFNQLDAYIHPSDEFHSSEYDQYYEAHNKSAVAAPNGNVTTNITLTNLKYRVSAYSWAKVYLEDNNFLKRFNDSLYERALVDINSLNAESALRNIVENIKPFVEGLPVSAWYQRQFILNASPSQGYKLYQRISQYTLDYFYRHASGYEEPQGGVTLSLKVFNHAGTLIFNESGASVPIYGWYTFNPSFPGYTGRIKVVASVESPEGLLTDTVFRSHQPVASGVFGVVEFANTGTISITPLDTAMATQTATLNNGAFYIASLQNVKGRFRIEYNFPECNSVTRIFTKDRNKYFISLKNDPLTSWKGTNSASWHDALNWSSGKIPDECTDVIINPGTTFNCVINSPAACRSLTAGNGVVITANNNLLIKNQ